MNNLVTVPQLKTLLGRDEVKNRFQEIMGKKAPGFISSILSLTNGNAQLQKAEPHSILNAAVVAATLDLPINPNLGFAAIVPYKNTAQFQLQYKGLVQLAMRSGQYKTINVSEVYEGEIKNVNRFTGDYEFGERTSDMVVGYMAYFKLVNGFEKYSYMTVDEIKEHAARYSKTYQRGDGVWKDNFDAMAKKTVLKLLLSKFGILSIEMQRAQTFDQSSIKSDLTVTDVDDAEIEYVDNDSQMEARKALIEDVSGEEETNENQVP
ncbi:recombinase RecT [Paraprevotella xylaniphila]|uniref:recombinase RecT n=1 Tax=Paraprevotella xylaniphila TaxID=454155 RepID=UPI0039F4A012